MKFEYRFWTGTEMIYTGTAVGVGSDSKAYMIGLDGRIYLRNIFNLDYEGIDKLEVKDGRLMQWSGMECWTVMGVKYMKRIYYKLNLKPAKEYVLNVNW